MTTTSSSTKKKKKIIDDEDEDEDFKMSDIKSSIDEDEYVEEFDKKKKNKKANAKKTPVKNKSSKVDDFDDEQLQLIEEEFEKLEEEEKRLNNINISNKSNTVNNINTNTRTKTAEKKGIAKNTENTTKSTKKEVKPKKPAKKVIIPDKVGVLNGLTFVITGELTIDRESMTNLIKGLGGRCSSKISKNTNYLITGSILVDGRFVNNSAKYKEAVEKNIKIINEQEFEEFLKVKLNDISFELKSGYNQAVNKEIDLGKVDNSKNKTNGSEIIVDPIPNLISKTDLWTTKHAPKEIDEVIGNQKVISQLIAWLDGWEDVVLNGNKKEIESSNRGRGRMENPNAKACMISGDPGIGKTTVVRLLAKLKGYRTYEQNASDQRNKSIITSKLGYLFDNTTLFAGVIQKKNLIIMDEVDGMGGNEDRGGVSALIDIVKKTKTPIICIANDKGHPKLRSLINHCYDLRFSKPDKRLVVSRLLEICQKEKFDVELNALEYLCENVGNDIRQCLNFLEFWSKKSKDLTFFNMTDKDNYKKFNKDSLLMVSNFDASAKLLNKVAMKKLSFRDKLNIYFIDYDLIPLLIHENYLYCYTGNNSNNNDKNDKTKDLQSLVKSTEHISVGDLLEKKIRSQQEWSLLQNKGIHSCLAVGQFSGNFISYPKFPEIMGKFMKIKKVKRELKELKYSFPNSSTRSIKEEIIPLILSKIANTLIDFGNEGIENCINFMIGYKITLDKFKENVIDLQPNQNILNKFEKITPQIRAALTRKYNEHFKTSVIRKSRKEKEEESNVKYDNEGNILEQIMEEIEEDDDKSSNLEIKTKKTKAKAKAKTSKVAPKNKKSPITKKK